MTKRVERLGERSCEIERRYAAPAAIVYAAMTDPDELRRWLSADGGYELVECVKDLRAGGAWRNVLKGADGSIIALSGRYLAVVPDRRLSFTEDFGDFRGEMIVTVDLDDSADPGSTIATTTVEFASPAIRDAVVDGDTIDASDGIYARLDAHVAAMARARAG